MFMFHSGNNMNKCNWEAPLIKGTKQVDTLVEIVCLLKYIK